MADRTCSGLSADTRRTASGSARKALTFERAPIHVAGLQSWCALSQRSSSSPTVRNGAARRMARRSAHSAASSLRRERGVLGRAVKGEGTLHRASRDRVDPHGDADLPGARAALAHGAVTPRHAPKSRDESRDRARIPGPRRGPFVASTLDLHDARSEGFEPPTF